MDNKLDRILQAQTQLVADINSNFLQQSQQLERMINSKMDEMRQEMQTKLGAITTELEDVRTVSWPWRAGMLLLLLPPGLRTPRDALIQSWGSSVDAWIRWRPV